MTKPASIRCRLRIHTWDTANPIKTRDDSIATASGGITVIAAYRYRYNCVRCGLDSDEHYGYTRTEEDPDV